ncbi:MAG: hypothetical protein JNN05_07290 [Candidatus Omnitrophica bacterium]|nr:hypothetical protein [Candidatus Omnitrophota bacterium]
MNMILLLVMLFVTPVLYAQEPGPTVTRLNRPVSSATALASPTHADPITDGVHTEYYEEGKIQSKVEYQGGQRHGLTQNFDYNGVLREEISYVNGVEHGDQKQYGKNGQLESQWSNRNGKRDGVYRGYFSDGRLAEERNFKDGVFFDSEGKPYNGIYQVNYPDGKVFKKFSYKDGLGEGLFQVFNPSGHLADEYFQVAGQIQGIASHYDEQTGELLAKVNYEHDRPNGLVQEFEKGKLLNESYVVDDVKNGPFKKYEQDGGHWEGVAVHGVIEGDMKFYDAQNRLRLTQKTQNNEPTGDPVFYDEKGKAYASAVVLDSEKEKMLFFVLWFVVFILSLTVHEAAHAWAALKLGDETAYKGGQVTVNPLPHIRREPIGMIALPVVTYWTQGWMIGWASAPYNPEWALEHPRRAALMSLAGPISNLILALAAGCALRLGLKAGVFTMTDSVSSTALFGGVAPGATAVFASFLSILFFLNIVLFAFNLMPLPPLDGSGVVPVILPQRWAERYITFVSHPTVTIGGILIAWKSFDLIAPAILDVFTSGLFFGL